MRQDIMRTTVALLFGLVMLASDSLTIERDTRVADQCLLTGWEFLTNMTRLCHYNCPGHEVSVRVVIPDRCLLVINV